MASLCSLKILRPLCCGRPLACYSFASLCIALVWIFISASFKPRGVKPLKWSRGSPPPCSCSRVVVSAGEAFAVPREGTILFCRVQVLMVVNTLPSLPRIRPALHKLWAAQSFLPSKLPSNLVWLPWLLACSASYVNSLCATFSPVSCFARPVLYD